MDLRVNPIRDLSGKQHHCSSFLVLKIHLRDLTQLEREVDEAKRRHIENIDF